MANGSGVRFDGDALHRALARGLGLDPTVRYRAVVDALTERGATISPQRYNDVRKLRRYSLDTLELWLRLAGLDLHVSNGVLMLPGKETP